MSEIELIATALAAGAGAGATGVASDAVRDAYAGLRGLLRARLAARPMAQQKLDMPEPDPDRWVAAIGPDLTEVGADEDQDVLAAARALLHVAPPHGHHHVRIWDSKGIVVGDHNTNNLTFNG